MRALLAAATLLIPGGLIIGGLLWYLTKDMDMFNKEEDSEATTTKPDPDKVAKIRGIDFARECYGPAYDEEGE
jgi:hypothetical protein